MDRMTHERVNGIKTGYWSPAKKEELVQRLAAYEDTGLEPAEIIRVVRCRDCRCKIECCRTIRSDGRLPDDFCSCGERGEDGDS